jgi:hypothetical protein
MGSFSGEPYYRYCADCEDIHATDYHTEKLKSKYFAQLPESKYPWITVKYRGDILFVNQDWAPRVLTAEGKWGVLKAHLPSWFHQ